MSRKSRTAASAARSCIALLAATIFVAFPSPAVAGWQGAVTISARSSAASYPQVAFDRRGDATAVWMELKSRSLQNYAVMSSTRRAATGRWTRPVQLSAPGQAGLFPRLAVNAAGAAVVAWESGGISTSPNPLPPSVQARFRSSATGAWRRQVRLSRAGATTAMVKVGIDARGNAVALWFTVQPGMYEIQVAAGSVATGRWSRPRQLAADRRALINPQIAVNARGAVAATWEIWTRGGPINPNGETNTVIGAVKPSGRPWVRPSRLGTETDFPLQASASFEFPGPHVAIDAGGDAVVVWQAKRGTSLIAETSERLAGGRWQRAAAISRTPALTPHVAMDAQGDATVVWIGPNLTIVAAAKTLRARKWSATTTLARGLAEVDPYPQVAMDGRGDAVATWDGKPVEAAVRRGPTGSWRNAVKLGPGGVPQVALDPFGRALVVWQRPTARAIVIDAAPYIQ